MMEKCLKQRFTLNRTKSNQDICDEAVKGNKETSNSELKGSLLHLTSQVT